MKLTKATVAQLSLSAGQAERIAWDSDVAGLGVRLRAGGSRRWIFQYRLGRQQRRIVLGDVNALSAADARMQAAKLHAMVKLGQDPARQKAESMTRAAETFGFALPLYLKRQEARLRPRSLVEVTRHLRVHAAKLHRLPIAGIDRRILAALLVEVDQKSGPTSANCVRASLSAFFAWAMREGLVDANPAFGTNKAVENGARDRALADAELAQVWNGAGDGEYGAIVRLLVLWGARRSEVGGLRWSEIDFDRAAITLPAERVKNGREFVIPLTAAARAIFEALPREGEYIFGRGAAGFNGWAKCKAELDRKIQIAPWVLHDLRRTMSTVMHDRLSIQPHIVEACLNHTSGHRHGVAGIYNRASYFNEKAAALTRWAGHVLSVAEGREARIVAMRA
jgi:integrase